MMSTSPLLKPLYEKPIHDIRMTEQSTGNENSKYTISFCYNCEQVLGSKSLRTRHDKMHARQQVKMLRASRPPKQRVYTCKECLLQFDKKRLLNKHAKQHVKLFTCKLCEQSFTDRLAFDLHDGLCGTDVNAKNKSPALCTRSQSRLSCSGRLSRAVSCDAGFYSMRATSAEPDSNSESEVETELLSVELERRQRAKSVESWLRSKRYSIDSALFVRSNSPTSSMWNGFSYARPSTYFCSYSSCLKAFPSLNWVTAHEMAEHKMLALFRCKECRKRFTSSENLRRHVIDNHQNLVICVLCDVAQKGINGMEQHFEMHRRYSVKCDICGKLFLSEVYLQYHMQLKHTTYESRTIYRGHILERFDKRDPRRLTKVHNMFDQHSDPDLGAITYSAHIYSRQNLDETSDFVPNQPWRT